MRKPVFSSFHFLLIICLGVLIPGCASDIEQLKTFQVNVSAEAATMQAYKTARATHFPAYTEAAKLTEQAQSTEKAIEGIPTPTRTPSTTPTPPSNFLIPTLSSVPTKQIFIVFGHQDGDASGDHFLDLAYVLHEPIVVIYTDGQALIKRENWFIEEWLSEPQLCSLYTRLKDAIEASDLADRYNASPTPEYCISGCGGPSLSLRIAGGEFSISHSASMGELKYLSSDATLPFQIIEDFAKTEQYQRFVSEQVAIWFEHVQRRYISFEFEGFPVYWPEYPYTYLALEPFIGDFEAGFILVEGSESSELHNRFPNMPTVGLHRENNRDYVLILRPLLPHEGLEDLLSYRIIPYPSSPDEIDLSCVQ